MYRKNMDEFLAYNASHTMNLQQLVEYYHRKKQRRNTEAFVLLLINIME